MSDTISAEQLWEARDAAMAALGNSWSAIDRWSHLRESNPRYTGGDFGADIAAIKSCQNRLAAALDNGVLDEIEKRSLASLPAVIFEGHTFATAHEAAKRAVRLAVFTAEDFEEYDGFLDMLLPHRPIGLLSSSLCGILV